MLSSLEQKSSEAERSITRVGGIETVSPDVFKGAHYVALGHLHRPQSAGAPHIRYSGAPLAFGFDEAADVKSMALVDLDGDGGATVQTIPFEPLRKVRTVRGKIDELLTIRAVLGSHQGGPYRSKRLIDPMKRLEGRFPNVVPARLHRQ